jgi:molybdopterin converting factor small subunit
MPTLHLPSVLTPLTGGQPVIQTAGHTIADAIDGLGQTYPALIPRLRTPDGAPYAWVTIYVNDDDIRLLDGFATRLEPNDEITVVPAVAGG